MALAHYIIVRRDLPLGTLAAMITHAAGESASEFDIDAYCYRPMEARGYNDPPTFFTRSVAVVLEVKNEKDLLKAHTLLDDNGISHTLVRESASPWDGAAMAIGLTPIEREEVSDLLADYQTLKTLDKTPEEKIAFVEGLFDRAFAAQVEQLDKAMDTLEGDECNCTCCVPEGKEPGPMGGGA